MRIRLDIAYVGTKYVGWQRQSKGASIQETLELVLSKIYDQKIFVSGAGRTDAGVHAAGQVAHFDVSKSRPPVQDLSRILNKLLPSDIVVFRAKKVSSSFHARKSAVRRTYLYRILLRRVPDPFRASYVWHAPWLTAAGLGKMRRAARLWLGTKDFARFAIRIQKGGSTYRRMEKIEIRRVLDELQFRFVADAFMHRMIRRMVAVLADTGMGKPVSKPSFSAPAGGLSLEKVDYR